MIRNIVWDMGNVLADFNVQHILEGLVREEHREAILEAVFHTPDWIRFDAGDIESPEEMAELCRARTDQNLWDEVDAAVFHWYEYTMEPIRETEALVRKLKAAGYHQYVLSNVNVMVDRYKDSIPAFGLMDGLYFSAFKKMMKPERRIYRGLLDEYGLKAEESVFVDDNYVNVAGAMIAGMHGIVFTGDIGKLEEELKKHNVQW